MELAVAVARCAGWVCRALLRLDARQQCIARLPERREEQVAQRAYQHLHRRPTSAGGLEAEVALRQLEMGGAEDVEYLVKVGQLLGAVIKCRMCLWGGIEVYQRGLLACQRSLEGIPQVRGSAQNRAKAGGVGATAVAQPSANHQKIGGRDEFELAKRLHDNALRRDRPPERPRRLAVADAS